MRPRKATAIRVFALCGICAAALDLPIILIAGALRADFSGVSSPASLLGVPGAPYARAISIWWVLYGIMLVCFAIGLYWSMPKEQSLRWIGPALIAVFGIFDGIGSGAFPCDPGCAELTVVARIHDIVSVIGTAALAISPFFCWLGWRGDRQWVAIRRYSGIIQLVAVFFGFVALIALLAGASGFFASYEGLLQRLLYGLYYVWLIPVGIRLFRVSRQSSALPR